MKQIKQPSHVISGVFVFLLLGIFAVFSTVMVVMGAKAYKGTADRAAEHNAARLAGAYIRSMVRSDDEEAAVRAEVIQAVAHPQDEEEEYGEYPEEEAAPAQEETGAAEDAPEADEAGETPEEEDAPGVAVTVPAIVMENTYGGEAYVTRIYVYGGMLREWNTSADMDFEPENGEAICPADEMNVSLENGILTVRLRSGEAWNQVDIALRTAR